jgi:hypothetical protein
LKGLRSHIAQREECQNAMQRVADKRQPKLSTAEDEPATNNQPADNIEMMDVDIPDAFDPPQPEFDPPHRSLSPSMDPGPAEKPDMRARVEEVDDEEAGERSRWVEDYPRPAGTPGQPAKSYFEEVRAEQCRNGQEPWAPFEDQDEWELAQWLLQNVGQNVTEKFLKLPIVSHILKTLPNGI